MKKFLQEFQTFISRGNVLDLAVAVIIGAAFSAIVNSLVKDLINPLLGFLVGKPDFTGLFIVLSEPAGYTGPRTYEALTAAGATVFGYGAFLTAVVHFLLLAFFCFIPMYFRSSFLSIFIHQNRICLYLHPTFSWIAILLNKSINFINFSFTSFPRKNLFVLQFTPFRKMRRFPIR